MNAESTFQTHRPRLMALAYRLLGSRADAEDVVQDAWLRWSGADPASVRDAEAWLVTATTRLGLDRLRAARRERAHYVGPWLAEPLAISLEPDPAPGPAQRHALADDVSVAFLTLLEQLGPEERAAFLLKEVFDHDYAEIAELIGHSQANCRQLVHRARQRLQAGRPRFNADASQHRELLARFMHATQQGDSQAVQALLHANAPLVSDGGGVVTAAIRPLLGAERIGRLFWAIAQRGLGHTAQLGYVNGEPAILRFDGQRLHSVTTVQVVDGRIAEVYSVLNPEKLSAVVTAADAAASW
ncbi:RNA polymerase sigma-70 factor [Stenotrophomonas sp. S48]|uniref:RNA polymerase sigma-70 factor n=1 Tax=unclassified Stenotrophomonas TaxID=196198 RepID=UPI0019018543|nr:MULTISPECIES: RNA polymerase sigma-70 factor [unclassified Stenotrophomonas]MBK0025323.1 RNA polymerase sigma-70 factor [Stenotrophomonas sp. S48]MBK0047293.1 RNA polymerase sigma-70 factor [Stenotrophomonas sp. S49]